MLRRRPILVSAAALGAGALAWLVLEAVSDHNEVAAVTAAVGFLAVAIPLLLRRRQ